MTTDPSANARARAEEVNEVYRPTRIAGGVVARPATAATPTVHAFLRHLRTEGVLAVPEPLSHDDKGETLRYLDGESGGDAWSHQHGDEGLRSAARLLRRVHDASLTWTPPPDAVFNVALAPDGDDLVFCHGDPGPWNFVWHERRAVGLIDWDYLHPGSRIDDVAYALFWFAPMRADGECLAWHHFPQVPDRRARIGAFLDAYGDLAPFDVVDTVIARRQRTIDHVRALADAGIEPQRTWVADGLLEQEYAEIDWIHRHRAMLSP